MKRFGGFSSKLQFLHMVFTLSARFRDAREGRKMKMDPSYKYIFEVLSEKLGLDIATVEELILDCPSVSLKSYHYF